MFSVMAIPLAADATKFLNSVDWTKPTWDMFIVLVIAVGAIFFGSALGRDRIMVNMVALYMAIAVMKSIPDSIMLWNGFIVQLSAFVGLIAIFVFLLSRSALQRTIAAVDTRGSWWQAIVYSILQLGLFISVILSMLPDSSLNGLQPLTRQIFVNDGAAFAWIVVPIFVMVLLRGGAAQKDKKYKYDL